MKSNLRSMIVAAVQTGANIRADFESDADMPLKVYQQKLQDAAEMHVIAIREKIEDDLGIW